MKSETLKYEIHDTLHAKRYPLYAIISTNSYVRIYKQIMQNKPNFMRFSPENADFTKKQTQLKPIQTQLKPIQSQFNPIQSQNKANFGNSNCKQC